jgi:hypothetical protein
VFFARFQDEPAGKKDGGGKKGGGNNNDKAKKQILFDITGRVLPGNLKDDMHVPNLYPPTLRN